MQVQSFLPSSKGPNAADPSAVADERPSRVAKGFARLLAGPPQDAAMGEGPTDMALVLVAGASVAPDRQGGQGGFFSGVGGAALRSSSGQERAAAAASMAQGAGSVPRVLADLARSGAVGAEIAQAGPGGATAPKEASGDRPPQAQGPVVAGTEAGSAESQDALPQRSVAAHPAPPEHAPAPGLARAPGLVGEGALPQAAVAKGIRGAPLRPDLAAPQAEPGSLAQADPPVDSPPPLEAGAEGGTGRHDRAAPQDRPAEKDAAEPAPLRKEAPAIAVVASAQDAGAGPGPGAEAGGPAEVRAAGPSGGAAAPSVPLQSAGPPQPAIQQLALAIRRSGAGEIEIALQPEELGKVRLTIAPQDTRVAVSVIVERAETLELIRRHIDALTSDLRQQGYSQVTLDFAQGQSQDRRRDLPDLPQQAGPSSQTDPAQPGPIPPRRPERAGGLDLRL